MTATDQSVQGGGAFDMIQRVDRAAVCLPRSLVARIIRRDYGLGAFAWRVPHDDNYVIDHARLTSLIDPHDLPIDVTDLPARLILISELDRARLPGATFQKVLRYYWRQLYHARLHIALEESLTGERGGGKELRRRIEQIGPAEFGEIRLVLKQERLLFEPEDDREVYIEFAATFLELRRFDPDLLDVTFPALAGRDDIDRLLAEDVDAQTVFDRTRPQPGMPPVAPPGEFGLPAVLPAAMTALGRTFGNLGETFVVAIKERAQRFRRLGNYIRAALTRGSALGEAEARPDLKKFVEHLRPILDLTGEQERLWVEALEPLIVPAMEGYRSFEARVLYDLQKLVNDHRRELSSINPVEWVLWWGQVPLKRPLPLAREALLLRHLRDAQANLHRSTLPWDERARLEGLLAAALHHVEHRFHEAVVPIIGRALDDAGLKPANAAERCARETLRAELADRIVSQGRLSFSAVRDAVSHSQLKLPDVENPLDLLFGDHLLKLDRRLALTLDGVYRRAEVYFRWLQTLTAFFFGTPVGRRLTLLLILPFGAAFLLLAFLQPL